MGVVGDCRLCRSRSELRNSHILPEFLYNPLYDEKHRAIAVTVAPGARDEFLQKGLREPLLCQSCETRLSRYERLAADVLHRLPDTSAAKPGHVVAMATGDYATFKLFQLSLIWRMGIASHATFGAVSLGPHEDELRRMILDEDPGQPLDYCCVLISTRGPRRTSEIITAPIAGRLNGHRVYVAFFLGLAWAFFVSGHSNQMREVRSFLSRDGSLPINVSSKTVEDLISGWAASFREAGIA